MVSLILQLLYPEKGPEYLVKRAGRLSELVWTFWNAENLFLLLGVKELFLIYM
jgi:hypothetical protein